MNARIYYFTGSGNSLAVTRDIAGGIHAEVISIPSVFSQTTIKAETDTMGIVFPVYHQGLPVIVRKFAEKLEDLSGTYIFAVCTSGSGPALSLKYLQKQLKAQGGDLAGGFSVLMPYNYISPNSLKNFYSSFALRPTPPEIQQKMFIQWREQAKQICDYVLQRKIGRIDTNAYLVESLVDVLNLRNIMQKPVWLKAAGVSGRIKEPFPDCIRWMDQGFRVLESCTNCGTCSRICPVRSIDMKDGKPCWNHQCEQCFACLQWCPNEAIEFGNHPVHSKRYRHPEVTLTDMIQTNRR
jgi:ferredoxin